jgi:predicted nuclease of predicted toxin-antitoxin system
MKLLLDQNLSADAAVILRSRGMDAIHAGEIGLETAKDDAILKWCRTEERWPRPGWSSAGIRAPAGNARRR